MSTSSFQHLFLLLGKNIELIKSTYYVPYYYKKTSFSTIFKNDLLQTQIIFVSLYFSKKLIQIKEIQNYIGNEKQLQIKIDLINRK